MLLERTLTTLQSRAETPARARELGTLGYLQWMMLLPADAGYPREARRALAMAAPFRATDPAVAVFADLVRASLRGTESGTDAGNGAVPALPPDLSLPTPRRRGGARERRRQL